MYVLLMLHLHINDLLEKILIFRLIVGEKCDYFLRESGLYFVMN